VDNLPLAIFDKRPDIDYIYPVWGLALGVKKVMIILLQKARSCANPRQVHSDKLTLIVIVTP